MWPRVSPRVTRPGAGADCSSWPCRSRAVEVGERGEIREASVLLGCIPLRDERFNEIDGTAAEQSPQRYSEKTHRPVPAPLGLVLSESILWNLLRWVCLFQVFHPYCLFSWTWMIHYHPVPVLVGFLPSSKVFQSRDPWPKYTLEINICPLQRNVPAV